MHLSIVICVRIKCIICTDKVHNIIRPDLIDIATFIDIRFIKSDQICTRNTNLTNNSLPI